MGVGLTPHIVVSKPTPEAIALFNASPKDVLGANIALAPPNLLRNVKSVATPSKII